LNLGLAAVLLLIATGPFGLDARALGLKGGIAGSAAAGAAIGAALTLPLFVGATAPATAARLADRRVADLCGRRLAYQVLVRIPLGTALVEEVAFRGVLLAAWRPWGPAAGRRCLQPCLRALARGANHRAGAGQPAGDLRAHGRAGHVGCRGDDHQRWAGAGVATAAVPGAA
jgi:hypothetical protein